MAVLLKFHKYIQVLPLHTMQAEPGRVLVIASRCFSRQKPTNMMPGGSALVLRHYRIKSYFGCCAVENMFISVAFISTLNQFVTTSKFKISLMVINSIAENPCERLMRN